MVEGKRQKTGTPCDRRDVWSGPLVDLLIHHQQWWYNICDTIQYMWCNFLVDLFICHQHYLVLCILRYNVQIVAPPAAMCSPGEGEAHYGVWRCPGWKPIFPLGMRLHTPWSQNLREDHIRPKEINIQFSNWGGQFWCPLDIKLAILRPHSWVSLFHALRGSHLRISPMWRADQTPMWIKGPQPPGPSFCNWCCW